MDKIAIREWVEQNPDYRPFRQAVHIILTAVSGAPDLQDGHGHEGRVTGRQWVRAGLLRPWMG